MVSIVTLHSLVHNTIVTNEVAVTLHSLLRNTIVTNEVAVP